MQPYEIVAAPFTVYIAPYGTAMPLITLATPASPWALLGTSGSKSYTDAGVSVSHSQTISSFTPAGSTNPRKAWRTAEEMVVSVAVADLSVEAYAQVLDSNAIVTTTTDKSVGIMRGVQVNLYALLVRGISPYNETKNAQYEIPACYEAGSPTLTFSKANPVELALEFHVFEAVSGVLATFRAAT